MADFHYHILFNDDGTAFHDHTTNIHHVGCHVYVLVPCHDDHDDSPTFDDGAHVPDEFYAWLDDQRRRG